MVKIFVTFTKLHWCDHVNKQNGAIRCAQLELLRSKSEEINSSRVQLFCWKLLNKKVSRGSNLLSVVYQTVGRECKRFKRTTVFCVIGNFLSFRAKSRTPKLTKSHWLFPQKFAKEFAWNSANRACKTFQ